MHLLGDIWHQPDRQSSKPTSEPAGRAGSCWGAFIWCGLRNNAAIDRDIERGVLPPLWAGAHIHDKIDPRGHLNRANDVETAPELAHPPGAFL
jgi:hypothetical protein